MKADEKTCPRCAETVKRAALVCKHCGHEFSEPSTAGQSGNPEPTQAKKKRRGMGCLIALAVIITLAIMASLFGPSDTSQQASTAASSQSPPASTTPASTQAKPSPPDSDLVHDKGSADYVEAVHQLILKSGYECPRLGSLWVKGRSPLGPKLEALCGDVGTTDVAPNLHYIVYPQRLSVVVCKPFGMFGGGCD